MSNVIPIPCKQSVNRILEKIVSGQTLNPAEKALLRWTATQPRHAWTAYQPKQDGMNREPAA